MSTTEPVCPQCRERMEEGLLLDRGHGNRLTVLEWLAGQPEPSFWRGLETKGRRKRRLVAYRCPRCGLVQTYARG